MTPPLPAEAVARMQNQPVPMNGSSGGAPTLSGEFDARVARIERNLGQIIKGKDEGIRLLLIALLSGGHVLLEDVPGTGKTTLAKALARSIDGTFHRIQFTPDLLPADVTGNSFYNPREGTFVFRPGPIFTNILLADEINRTSPRTQSALLEVMSENQATIEGEQHELLLPFFVIATQNPSDYAGTYPLPEAQLDRFAVRITLGYPDIEHELEILFGHNSRHPLEDLTPVVTTAEILEMQEQVKTVRVDRSIAEYILRLIETTRNDQRLRLGISPRGSLTLYRTAQARARLLGREYVLPEDVRALAVTTLAHRLQLDAKSRYGGMLPQQIVEDALERTPVPR